MLKLIHTPENIFADADVYLRIYIGGFVFLFLYNVVTGVFTSLGDSKTPLYFLIGSSLSNILLDWVFVAIFHLDVVADWLDDWNRNVLSIFMQKAYGRKYKRRQNMGLFDFFKKPKTDLEQYYEDRKKRENENFDNGQEENFTTAEVYFQPEFSITVQDVFVITGRGTVIVGQIASGSVRVGDTVILKRLNGSSREVTVTGIEMFRKMLDVAKEGDNVGILLRGLTKADIGKGDVLLK